MIRCTARLLFATLVAALPHAALHAALAAQADTVSVFVLAGQSNMEGKAQNKLWTHQAQAAATKAEFAAFRHDGDWIARDDVFIDYLGRRGKLTLGYGSLGRTGCELAFGWVVGDELEGPVLLIKTAWGGRSLRKDFRPPSAALPPLAVLEKELAARTKRVEVRNEKTKGNDPLPTLDQLRAEYGLSYREMLQQVRETLADCDTLFPALAGKKKALKGFVWFQGWNDQYGGAELEYEKNLRHLVADVRRDLAAPELPVVIGVMGQNGSKPRKGAMATIQAAQIALGKAPDLQNVRSVETDVLVDKAAEALYPDWKERREEWERTGSDHPYHYLGSALWFTRIGRAFGKAMLSMQR